MLGIDHRYIDTTATNVSNLVYGLDLALDLNSALGIPEKVGELISTHVIPKPHLSLEDVLPIGKTATVKAK